MNETESRQRLARAKAVDRRSRLDDAIVRCVEASLEFADRPTFEGLRESCLSQRRMWSALLSAWAMTDGCSEVVTDEFRLAIDRVLAHADRVDDYPDDEACTKAATYCENIRDRRGMLDRLLGREGMTAVRREMRSRVDKLAASSNAR